MLCICPIGLILKPTYCTCESKLVITITANVTIDHDMVKQTCGKNAYSLLTVDPYHSSLYFLEHNLCQAKLTNHARLLSLVVLAVTILSC